MSTDLARWQFATTSIYHFLFVPVTIGLAFLVALLQTTWYRNDNPTFKRLTKFFGTLLLINVAIGVVTGLVQEFEFGMNWSNYSRLVGNIFGGPLGHGGTGRLLPRVHLPRPLDLRLGPAVEEGAPGLHLAGGGGVDAVGPVHHGGQLVDAAPGRLRDELPAPARSSTTSGPCSPIPVFLWAYPHVILASLVTGAMVMLAVSAWHLRRKSAVEAFRRTAIISLAVLTPAVFVNMFIGSELGVVEGKYQPMKIAAAEALWNTCPSHCSFSLFQIGGGNNDETPTQIIEIPDLLSILATNHVDGEVQGMNNLQAQYVKEYGPGNYVPNVFIQYWGMRVMAYLAALIALFALWGLWLIRRKTLEKAKWFLFIAPWFVIAPFLMNTAGWLLTESGRQPWIVQGLMKTSQAASPSVTTTDIWISLSVFVVLYAALGAADGYLMVHYGRKELALGTGEGGDDGGGEDEGDGSTGAVTPSPPRQKKRPTTGSRPSSTRSATMVHLNNIWFIIVAVFWVGFFVLEGFDFGVGMLHSFVGRNDAERRVAVNSIGPIWDGNEVWLVVAGASHLRRLPVVVRHHVLHLLPGPGRRAGRPDRAGGVLRVQPQDRRSAVARHLALVADHRQPPDPPAARYRPRRPAPRAADRLSAQLHRQLRRAAGSLRPLHRAHLDRVVAVPRGGLPDPQDRGRTPRPGAPACRAGSAGWPQWSPSAGSPGSTWDSASALSPTRSTLWRWSPSSAAALLAEARARRLGLRGGGDGHRPASSGSIFFELFPRVMVSSTNSAYNLTVANSASPSLHPEGHVRRCDHLLPLRARSIRGGASTCSASGS